MEDWREFNLAVQDFPKFGGSKFVSNSAGTKFDGFKIERHCSL